jgi:CelD/BcsL family acetyltransferase involved in cellulose biosynthesis
MLSSNAVHKQPEEDFPDPFAVGRDGDFIVRIYAQPDRAQLELLHNSLLGTVIHTPFQAASFLDPFYEHAGTNATSLIMEIARAGDGGSLMLMPLLMRQSLGVTKIEGADLGFADYVAPIAVEGFRPSSADLEAIRRALLAALPQVDLLSLKKMPRELGLATVNPFALLQGSASMGISTKVLDLRDADCPSHYKRSGIYKDGMRQMRRLQKKGQVEFRVATTPEDAQVLFSQLVEQRRARFEAVGRPDPLADPNVHDFYQTMVCRGVPDGTVLFGGLFLDDVCIATDLGLVQGDTHFGIFTTMRSGALSSYSPGTIAFMLILDETVARGIEFYDIGVGEFPYKDRLKGRIRPLYEWNQALTIKGHIAAADLALRRNVRIGLKQYPGLRQPAMWLRETVHSLRKWIAAASFAVFEWPVAVTMLPLI